jgi:tetratricopeptide (TPR) repeat protein
MNTTNTKETLHIRIAEKGKVYSLEGNYKEALRHYKEAIKMMQQTKDSEIFFQHYSQCVMEALELSEAYDQVISFCERYIDFLDEKDGDNILIKKHYATILEKQAIQYLHKEEKDISLELLKEVQQHVGKGKQPITDQLLNWFKRCFFVTKKQISALQKKHQYFIVRADVVNPKIAFELPTVIS